jgi:hypothetical protein
MVKSRTYLRYGDDFFIITDSGKVAATMRTHSIGYLRGRLRLEINPKHDILIPTKKGLRFLGVEAFPEGRRLNERNRRRIVRNLRLENVASYRGLSAHHEKEKRMKRIDWTALGFYDGF